VGPTFCLRERSPCRILDRGTLRRRSPVSTSTSATLRRTTLWASSPTRSKAVLRKAAEPLTEVQAELGDRGLGLKVFDDCRPYGVTESMWKPYQDPGYVADPAEAPAATVNAR
jgi:D-alanyl-D-alanine dipeptidase